MRWDTVAAGRSVDPTVGPERFKQLFRRHPGGVTVVTLSDPEGGPVGFTATSVISVAAEPATVAFSVAGTSRSWPSLARSRSVVINFLAGDQVEVAQRFASTGIDRFAGTDWSRLESGEPVLDGCHSWLRGRILERIPVGGSFLVLVRVVQAAVVADRPPLVYHDRAHHGIVAHPGHSLEAAPTPPPGPSTEEPYPESSWWDDRQGPGGRVRVPGGFGGRLRRAWTRARAGRSSRRGSRADQ